MIERISNFVPAEPASGIPANECPGERLDRLSFHIENDDYLPNLAALLGFVEEALHTGQSCDESRSLQLAAVRRARKDLCHLHDKYRLHPRTEPARLDA